MQGYCCALSVKFEFGAPAFTVIIVFRLPPFTLLVRSVQPVLLDLVDFFHVESFTVPGVDPDSQCVAGMNCVQEFSQENPRIWAPHREKNSILSNIFSKSHGFFFFNGAVVREVVRYFATHVCVVTSVLRGCTYQRPKVLLKKGKSHLNLTHRNGLERNYSNKRFQRAFGT